MFRLMSHTHILIQTGRMFFRTQEKSGTVQTIVMFVRVSGEGIRWKRSIRNSSPEVLPFLETVLANLFPCRCAVVPQGAHCTWDTFHNGSPRRKSNAVLLSLAALWDMFRSCAAYRIAFFFTFSSCFGPPKSLARQLRLCCDTPPLSPKWPNCLSTFELRVASMI